MELDRRIFVPFVRCRCGGVLVVLCGDCALGVHLHARHDSVHGDVPLSAILASLDCMSGVDFWCAYPVASGKHLVAGDSVGAACVLAVVLDRLRSESNIPKA